MRLWWLACAFVCACSSDVTSTASTAHLNGTVDDKTLTPRSAIGTRSASALTVLVSDRTNTCASTHTEGATSLTLTLHGAQIVPGTYAVSTAAGTDAGSAGAGGGATFTMTDHTCAVIDTQHALSGSITLNEISTDLTPGSTGSRARGSFTLTFANGHMVGDFDALTCTGPDAAAPAITCSP
jgi:hypothetical protein